jgi:hypothetical protein
MYVRLSVSREQLGSDWTEFHEIRFFGIFLNHPRKFKFEVKTWQEYQKLEQNVD